MISLFLAPIDGQLFGFHKEWVTGVGGRKAELDQGAEKNGRKYLRLPSGERAFIFPFHDLLDNRLSKPQTSLNYYLILHYHECFTALPIDGRGQWATVIEQTTSSLPPSFTGRSREFIRQIILNGNDIILMPDMDTLFEMIASDRSEDAAMISSTPIHEELEEA